MSTAVERLQAQREFQDKLTQAQAWSVMRGFNELTDKCFRECVLHITQPSREALERQQKHLEELREQGKYDDDKPKALEPGEFKCIKLCVDRYLKTSSRVEREFTQATAAADKQRARLEAEIFLHLNSDDDDNNSSSGSGSSSGGGVSHSSAR